MTNSSRRRQSSPPLLVVSDDSFLAAGPIQQPRRRVQEQHQEYHYVRARPDLGTENKNVDEHQQHYDIYDHSNDHSSDAAETLPLLEEEQAQQTPPAAGGPSEHHKHSVNWGKHPPPAAVVEVAAISLPAKNERQQSTVSSFQPTNSTRGSGIAFGISFIVLYGMLLYFAQKRRRKRHQLRQQLLLKLAAVEAENEDTEHDEEEERNENNNASSSLTNKSISSKPGKKEVRHSIIEQPDILENATEVVLLSRCISSNSSHDHQDLQRTIAVVTTDKLLSTKTITTPRNKVLKPAISQWKNNSVLPKHEQQNEAEACCDDLSTLYENEREDDASTVGGSTCSTTLESSSSLDISGWILPTITLRGLWSS
jgi:hypothetical protein